MQSHSLDLELSSSQYASIADGSQTGLDLTTALTIEAWVRFESLSSGDIQTIASKYDSGANQRAYQFFMQYHTASGERRLGLNLSGNGSAVEQEYVLWTPQMGVWYHVAVSYSNADEVKFYVDGSQQGATQTTAIASVHNSSAAFSVGSAFSSGSALQFFDGLIKDIRVFSDIRTAGEIAADAHAQTVSDANLVCELNFNNSYADTSGNGNTLTANGSPTFSTTIPWTAPSAGVDVQFIAGLVSWWDMDEASGTRSDAHASNDLTDNNTVGSANGKLALAADFEASNSESLSITDAAQSGMDFSTAFSIAGWYNFESLPSGSFGAMDLLAKWLSTGNQRSYIWSYRNDSSTPGFSFFVSSNGSANEVRRLNHTLSGTSTWIHIALTWSSGIATVYVNGVRVGTLSSGSITSIYNSTASVELGSQAGGQFFDGLMDEVSVYGSTLDYGNVLDLYNAGSGIPYNVSTQFAPRVSFIM